MEPEPDDPLEQFLRGFWRDVDAGSVAALAAYCARFPGIEQQIREEYSAWLSYRDAAPGDAATDLPTAVGRYRVLGQLARGGMGVLLTGYDPELHRRVVLKTPRTWSGPTSQHARERLQREARLASRLAHDGICAVLDVVALGDQMFVVMPFIDGDSLAEWLGRAAAARAPSPTAAARPPGPGRDTARLWPWVEHGVLRPVLELIEQVARIVHVAHEAGIVHRDIKPANLMVRRDGEPVVLDFGLAVELAGDDAERWTRSGELVGSPDYMAPEQIDGASSGIDRRVDVYGLGVVLYEVLTLVRPYRAPTQMALLDLVRRGSPRRPRTIDPRIPRDLEAVCLQAMAVDRAHRYGTALELAEDLRRVLMLQATQAHPLTTAGQFLRRMRRSPRLAVTAAAGLLLLAVTASLLLRQRELERRSACAEALLRVFEARATGTAPAAADLATLQQHVPDRSSLELLLQATEAGDVTAFVQATLRGLEDGFRGPVADAAARLLAPRAATVASRPRFVFRLAEEHERLRCSLIVRSAAGSSFAWRPSVVPTDDGAASCELPDDIVLAPGEYSWRIEADGAAPIRLPAAAHFTVVPPNLPTESTARLRPTGDTDLDRVLRALALLAHRLAEDATVELDRAPAADPAVEHLRRVALIMAARRLEDVDRLRTWPGAWRR